MTKDWVWIVTDAQTERVRLDHKALFKPLAFKLFVLNHNELSLPFTYLARALWSP